MKYQYSIIAICLCFCCIFPTFGQAYYNAIPLSVTENLPAIARFTDLPSVDYSLCKNETRYVQFACPIYTDLDPDNSGEWIETANGRVWRLGIRSANANSLYISMHYSLLPGVKLFVYDPIYRDFHGAFSNRNNNSAKVLSVAPVHGDRLIVELNLPAYLDSFGEIKITKVYHDYLNIFKDLTQGRTYLNCEEDINCSNGKYWQTEKRSVCKIISNGGMGTGTLIGNTSGSRTPYILSAYHLISSAEIAAEAIFVFNYETTSCDAHLTTNVQSLSGAAVVSTTDHQLDFTLMKLYEEPPLSYQPFYAGWDARNIIPKSGVCIHHPFESPKQIAIEYHPIKNEDIGEGFDVNSTWKISHWEVGTTELGSSGAPLFNEQHRIVGTLTGGRSSCSYRRDDYFTKFGVAWNTYPGSTNQLKYWLDPDRTGKLAIDGYDPYGFNAAFCDTAWNFSSHDKVELSNAGLDWGWISGHSSAGYTQFAERFESTGLLQINGVYLDVAKAFALSPLANIELKVWEGTQYPEQECYSKLLFIKDFQLNKINYVALDSILTKSGSFFVGYKINYNAASDTFALYHAQDRGQLRSSSMYVYNEGWNQSKDQATFGIATSMGLGISACYGKTRGPATDILNIYPNPAINSITLDIPGSLPIHEVTCFDNTGRLMQVELTQTEDGNKLHFNLMPGIYYLKIITAKKSFFAPFIVL